MPLHRPIQRLHSKSLRLPGLPGRTVRARLTWLYGSLFLASGIVLLVITGVLWSNATSGTLTAFSPVPNQVFNITGIGSKGGETITVGGRAQFAAAPPNARADTNSGPAQRRAQVVSKLKALAGEQHSSDLRDLLLYSGIAVAIMAILAVGVGWMTAGRVLRPLRSMTGAVRDISAHNLNERLHVEGPDDELTRLGNTFDQLLSRLERSFESQRLFAANASHELRTPLATMRAAIDVALAKPQPAPPETVRLAERLRDQLDQIDRLLDSLFSLARAQTGAADPGRPQSLDALVDSAVARRAGSIRRARLTIERNGSETAEVVGDTELLSRMVENVVDNAVRHNEPGGWIRLSCATEDDVVVLTIENGGRLLDHDAVAELGRPFRRLGPARTGSTSGTGLGLSIVDAIATAHGGRLVLDARLDGGLRVRIELPHHALELAGAPA